MDEQDIRQIIRDELQVLGLWHDHSEMQKEKCIRLFNIIWKVCSNVDLDIAPDPHHTHEGKWCVRVSEDKWKTEWIIHQEPNTNWLCEYYDNLTDSKPQLVQVAASGEDLDRIAKHFKIIIDEGKNGD